jgi:hypothetical protein
MYTMIKKGPNLLTDITHNRTYITTIYINITIIHINVTIRI